MLTASPSANPRTSWVETAALVRIPVAMPSWWHQLPVPPAGCRITVSLPVSDVDGYGPEGVAAPPDLGEHRRSGGEYLPVAAAYPGGLVPVDGRPVADLLVPQEAMTTHEEWWPAVRRSAQRIFDLRMGPVIAVLMPILRAHVDAVDATARHT